MRFKSKDKQPQKIGDKRSRVVFAYWPTKVVDEWIWLESYIVFEAYFAKTGWTLLAKTVLEDVE